MTILITGISSYVGNYLGNYYLSKNYKVIGVSRTNPNITHDNFTFLQFDLENSILNVVCDLLIHSAGEARLNLPFEDYYEKNIQISYNIKKYIEVYKIKAFLFSTHKVYGINNSPFIEETSDIITPCKYGLSKLVAEKILENNAVILRLPALIAKGSNGWIYKTIQSLNLNKSIIVYNSIFNNILHLRDLAEFIEIGYNKNIKNEIFLLSANDKVQSKDIVIYMKEKLNSTSNISVTETKSYYFFNKKMNEIYNPMNVYETIDLFLKDLN